MFGLSDVAVFVRVAEFHSFVGASQSLCVTPSATSKAVTRLEARLGARLLNRSTRSLSLTALGTDYFERCRQAFEDLEIAESKVAEARGVATGLLRIEVPTALGHSVVIPALPEFLQRHPKMRVHLCCNDRATDLVKAGFDAAIRVGVLPDSNLVARQVGRLAFVTCAAPSFLARYGLPEHPSELRPEDCIAVVRPRRAKQPRWYFRRQEVEHTLFPTGRLAFNDVESTLWAAIEGAGFVRALSIAVDASIAAGLLQPVLSDWNEGVSRKVYVVYPRHRQPTAMVKAFIDFALTLFSR